jgi:hypothetical protein
LLDSVQARVRKTGEMLARARRLMLVVFVVAAVGGGDGQCGWSDRTQFSLLIAVVVLSAIVPTVIAQRFFQPHAGPEAPSVPPAVALEGEVG